MVSSWRSVRRVFGQLFARAIRRRTRRGVAWNDVEMTFPSGHGKAGVNNKASRLLTWFFKVTVLDIPV